MAEATITCPTCEGHPASASTRSEGGSISCRHCNRTLTFNVMRSIEEGRDLECGCQAARDERCITCGGAGTIPDSTPRLVASGGVCAPPPDGYDLTVIGTGEDGEQRQNTIRMTLPTVAAERPEIKWHVPLQPWEMWDDGFGCYRLSLIGHENERRLADARHRVRNAWGFVRCAVPPLRSAARVLAGRPPYPAGDDEPDPEWDEAVEWDDDDDPDADYGWETR